MVEVHDLLRIASHEVRPFDQVAELANRGRLRGDEPEPLGAVGADDMFAQGVTGLRHALLGEVGPVVALVTGRLQSYLWNDPEWPWFVAGFLALVNERGPALDWLQRAVDRG